MLRQLSRPLLSFLLAPALVASACGGTPGVAIEGDVLEPNTERQLEASSSGTVDVDNPHGQAMIKAGEATDSATVSWWVAEGVDIDADLLEQVEVTATSDDGDVKVVVDAPSEVEQGIVVEVTAPDEMVLAIDAGEDEVAIDGMKGTGAIRTTSGDVSMTGFRAGTLAIDTTSGAVLFDAESLSDADVAINVSSADVTVTLPTDVSATVAATAGGEVTIEGLTFDGVAVGGTAAGDFGSGEGNLAVNVSEGNIFIKAR